MKKAFKNRSLKAFVVCNGRGERIRTFDPLVPNQMRYQAALRPDLGIVIAETADSAKPITACQKYGPPHRPGPAECSRGH